MATLELAIDATKAQQGAQVAQQAFVQVQKGAEGAAQAAAKTGQAVADSGAKMNAAFQATGGSIQIAGGIAQTAKAFGELNIQAGLFNSSRLLLEIGKTSLEFRQLASSAKESGSAFARLGAFIRQNPLLTSAAALSAAATAIGFLSDKTDKAASSTEKAIDRFQKLRQEIEQLKVDAATAEFLGMQGPRSQQQLTTAVAIGREIRQTGVGLNLQDVSQTPLAEPLKPIVARVVGQSGVEALEGKYGYGMSMAQSQRVLSELVKELERQVKAEKENTGAAEEATKARQEITEQLRMQLVQFGAEPLPGALGGFETRGYQPPYFIQRPTVAPGTYEFGAGPVPQQFPQVGFPTGGYATAGYQYSNGRLRPEYQVEPGQAPPLLARPDRITMTDTGGTATMASQAFENAVVTAAAIANYKKQEEEAARRVAENFQRAADYAGQVGGSLGSAFADVLMKTTTLRQAFASIVASFARQGLADIGSAIFRGAVSGLTPNQAGANVGINQQPQG